MLTGTRVGTEMGNGWGARLEKPGAGADRLLGVCRLPTSVAIGVPMRQVSFEGANA